MFKQLILLALACGVTAATAKKLAERRQGRQHNRQSHEVQRWEDEGGAVAHPANATADAAAKI